jgi:hypothetical protein
MEDMLYAQLQEQKTPEKTSQTKVGSSMIRNSSLILLPLSVCLSLPARAQQDSFRQGPSPDGQLALADSRSSDGPAVVLPDAPDAQNQAETPPPAAQASQDGKQSKRILGIIPNFRSVNANTKLPPLSPREKFKLTFQDSFDYSSFIYVGILSGISQAEDSYPEFHNGAPAYARYYWHSFADTVNGNLMTEFIFPVTTREDPRYYTLGHGGFLKRTGYAFSRLVITRTDGGGRSPNFSEIVGNGAAAGISSLYYPNHERTWTKTGQRWVTQVGLDGFSNLIKELWPDVNQKLFHNKY